MLQSHASYFLTTERLGLRRWSHQDLPLAMALWGDAEVTRFIGGPFSEDKVRERLEKEIASIEQHGVQYWPAFLLASEDFVGCCGLRSYRPEQKILELGFHLRPAYWGSGLAQESARAVIRFAPQSLGAEGLFAAHHPENQASQKVLCKLGFRFTHEELYRATGKLHRCYLLSLRK